MNVRLTLVLLVVVTAGALPASAQVPEGKISGVVVDSSRTPLANQRVELRQAGREERGRLVAATDGIGTFTFSDLSPGRYQVELVIEGRGVARSQVIELSEGSMRVSGVSLARPALPPIRPPRRARLSADRLLRGQSVTAPFEHLQLVLQPGHEIVVWDAAGQKRKGRVSSVSRDRLVLFTEGGTPLLRLLSPARERVFAADAVTQIDVVDSSWNGALIGAAIAPLLVYGIHRWEQSAVPDTNNLKGLMTFVFGSASAVAAIGLGHDIDLRINEPIYQGTTRVPRVTLMPWLEGDRKGIMAHVSF